jgi:hypothetical protein
MSKKVVLSLTVSVVLVAGIIGLSLTGTFIFIEELSLAEPEKYLIYTSIFLTLFLSIFFIFNIRQGSVRDRSAKSGLPEEFTAAPDGIKGLSRGSAPATGLLAAATAISARRGPPAAKPDELEELECVEKVIIEQDGIHFINSETFDRDSDKEELNGDFKELVESVVGKA